MRHLLTLAAALAMLLILAAPALAQDDLNCDDFGSQAEAQAHYDSDRSDPDRLDADSDGEACEEHDYAAGSDAESTADDITTPERAELGGGGAADAIDPVLASVAASGALLSFGGAVYVARRGR
jgi:hypothetical protein